MIGVTSLLVSFLFGSFYLSFRKYRQYSEGVGGLNALNQHLLEAAVQEKVFLKDASQVSLNRVVDSITLVKKEATSLKEFEFFQAMNMEALAVQLAKYSTSLRDLSKLVQAIDSLDNKIVELTASFGEKSNDVINMINEYESECQVQLEQLDKNLAALRDVARNTLVPVGEVFSVLKNDRIRNEVAISKSKMPSAGKEQMEFLERNVMRANFTVSCATLLVVILGGLFLMRSVVRPINRLGNHLNESSDQLVSCPINTLRYSKATYGTVRHQRAALGVVSQDRN
ncbi:MAG: hypothetical protein JXL84_26970 [Deltaproteobacteria bacterium]|nr:hypothetical protein [Deltaproteobacteria bacterium]